MSEKVRQGFGDLWRNCLWRRAPHMFLKNPGRNALLGPGALINTSRGEYVGDRDSDPYEKCHREAYAIWCRENFQDVVAKKVARPKAAAKASSSTSPRTLTPHPDTTFVLFQARPKPR